MTATTAARDKITAGTPEFRRVNIAVFSCGFSIFAILYCTQPVLPELAREFGVTAAQSSLALSLTTITMAIAMLVASSVSEVFGRKPAMVVALVSSSLLTIALAVAPDWSSVLWLRGLAGVALSGAPAVSIAYLGEEMEKATVARAVGIYIGGGIVPRLGERFDASPFRQRFEDKGRFKTYLSQIPTWVIHSPVSPALQGASQALSLTQW